MPAGAGPGLTLKQVYLPGLVQDFDWGNWERQIQYTAQFGLLGVTSIDGLRAFRQFLCPMMLYNGFVSQDILEAYVLLIEGYIGQVGLFTYQDLSGQQIRQFDNVEFFDFVRGRTRFDSTKGWMMLECKAVFRHLSPIIPASEQGLLQPSTQG